MNINCPHCDQNIDADDSYAGMTCDCPTCHQAFIVPDIPAASPPPLPQNPMYQRFDEVTAKLRKFLSEEQDPAVVQKIYTRAADLCVPDEDIKYIAVQKKPVVTISPDAVLLTNRRVIVFRSKLFGMIFEDVPWRDVHDIHVKEGILGATFTVRRIGGQIIEIDSLPKSQARKLYQFGQEMEEQAHHRRRLLALEDKRAAAGGIMIAGSGISPPPSNSDDPMQKLMQLKALHEQGLISSQEFDTKKAEILARM